MKISKTTEVEIKEAIFQIKLAIMEAVLDGDSRDTRYYAQRWVELEIELQNQSIK